MFLTTKQWKQIAQDLLEAGLNAMTIRREGGNEAVLEAWCELGDEGWLSS